MRRRTRVDETPEHERVPVALLDYRRTDWVGRGCHPECAFWEARAEWTEEHGVDAWPDIVAQGPDVPWHEDWTRQT